MKTRIKEETEIRQIDIIIIEIMIMGIKKIIAIITIIITIITIVDIKITKEATITENTIISLDNSKIENGIIPKTIEKNKAKEKIVVILPQKPPLKKTKYKSLNIFPRIDQLI